MALAALAFLPIFATASPLPAANPSEFELKAAYVLNILRFSSRKAPLTAGDLHLCLIRAGLMQPALQTLEGTPVQGRRLKVRGAAKGDINGCDVVFFGDMTGTEKILAKSHAMGLLSIGTEQRFVSLSGMVALVIEHRRIVVKINQAAVNSAQWTFSSHLLEVARVTAGGVP